MGLAPTGKRRLVTAHPHCSRYPTRARRSRVGGSGSFGTIDCAVLRGEVNTYKPDETNNKGLNRDKGEVLRWPSQLNGKLRAPSLPTATVLMAAAASLTRCRTRDSARQWRDIRFTKAT